MMASLLVFMCKGLVQCQNCPLSKRNVRRIITSPSKETNPDSFKTSSCTSRIGKSSCEIAYGIPSRTAEQADAQRVLNVNRGHWSIENSCHYIIDWNYDEDRSRIRTGYGPENMTRLRRFAIVVIKSKGVRSVAQKIRELTRNVRLVLDYRLSHIKFHKARGRRLCLSYVDDR